MNKNKLKENVGKKVRIIPIPYEQTSGGLREIDILWQIVNVFDSGKERAIELSNSTTNHTKKIVLDHVLEYLSDPKFRSDGFLILKSQLIIDYRTVHVIPVIDEVKNLRRIIKKFIINTNKLEHRIECSCDFCKVNREAKHVLYRDPYAKVQ